MTGRSRPSCRSSGSASWTDLLSGLWVRLGSAGIPLLPVNLRRQVPPEVALIAVQTS